MQCDMLSVAMTRRILCGGYFRWVSFWNWGYRIAPRRGGTLYDGSSELRDPELVGALFRGFTVPIDCNGLGVASRSGKRLLDPAGMENKCYKRAKGRLGRCSAESITSQTVTKPAGCGWIRWMH